MNNEPQDIEELLKAIIGNIENSEDRSIVELYLKNPDKLSKQAREKATTTLKKFLVRYPEISEMLKEKDEKKYEVLVNKIKIGSDYEISCNWYKSEITIMHAGVKIADDFLITRSAWDALREYIRYHLDTKQFDKYSFTKKIQQMYHQAKQGDKKCLTEEIIFENFK